MEEDCIVLIGVRHIAVGVRRPIIILVSASLTSSEISSIMTPKFAIPRHGEFLSQDRWYLGVV